MGWEKDLRPSGEPGSQIDRTVRRARRKALDHPEYTGYDAVIAALPHSKKKLRALVASGISSGDVPVEDATNGNSFDFSQQPSWKKALATLGRHMTQTAFHRRVKGKFAKEINRRYEYE